MTMTRFHFRLSPLLAACMLVGAMQTGMAAAADSKGDMPMAMTLTSPAFAFGEPIPTRYTCEGNDISPALAWRGVPDNARSLVLIVDDPDAPDPAAPQRTWVHWVLYNIPSDATGLPEGVMADLPRNTLEGVNDWGRTGYGGPCPPIGRHRYFFRLYALDRHLPDLGKVGKAEVEAAMREHIVAEATLVGTYQKVRR